MTAFCLPQMVNKIEVHHNAFPQVSKTFNFLFLMENSPSIWMENYKSSVCFIK